MSSFMTTTHPAHMPWLVTVENSVPVKCRTKELAQIIARKIQERDPKIRVEIVNRVNPREVA